MTNSAFSQQQRTQISNACERVQDAININNYTPSEQPSDGLDKASYHAAMELMNNPNFTPKTILGQFISMLQGLFKDGAQWPARAPHLLPV